MSGEDQQPRVGDVGPGGPLAGVLLEVAYDGTAFHGWAAQHGARTVQGVLYDAVRALDPEASPLRGASRTDAGVHAEGQLVAFETTRRIPPRGWVLGLNQRLPDDVAVRTARNVPPSFNPRFASLGKRYRYRVLVDDVRDPTWRFRAWRLCPPIDRDRLEAELAEVRGTHDFAAFRAAADVRTQTVRTINKAAVEEEAGGRVLGIVIEGDGFLYNMVRILVGTVMDVARRRMEPGAIRRALDARDRRLAGVTAPAHGLTLEKVYIALPEDAGEPWPR